MPSINQLWWNVPESPGRVREILSSRLSLVTWGVQGSLGYKRLCQKEEEGEGEEGGGEEEMGKMGDGGGYLSFIHSFFCFCGVRVSLDCCPG